MSFRARGTKLADAQLEHLEGLSRLQGLQLEGARAIAEGVKKLQQALLSCNILD